MRSQADRRVEVMFFDDGEEPNLAATNGEDVYDGVTFERTPVEPMKSARRTPVIVALRDTAGQPVVGAGVELSMGDAVYASGITNSRGECQLKAEELPEVVLRITQVDESKFSTAELVEQPYYFAEEFAEGVLLPFARNMIVTLSLCHVNLTLDDTTLLSEPQIATLVSADGTTQRQTQLPARTRGNVASVVEFAGLPTFSKKYRLSITTGKLADIVFEGQTLLEVAGIINHARDSLVEPESDSVPSRTVLRSLSRNGRELLSSAGSRLAA